MNIKGVLFDFDGTLTEPGAIDFQAIKEELGCPADETILEYLETQPAARRTEQMKILEQREEKAAEVSRPNQGAEKCVMGLKERGISLGILTRNSLVSVKKSLDKFDSISIDDFFTVITRDVSQPKPNPDGVLRAATEMGLSPSRILLVGDYRFDVIAGKAAGACTALLVTDGRPVMKLGDPEPDYVIAHLEEVLDIV